MLFVMGGGSGRRNAEGRLNHGGHWRAEQAWPIERAQLTRYYLREGGALNRTPAPAGSASRSYRFDPADPVITVGGSVVSRPPAILAGGFDQVEQPQFFGCACRAARWPTEPTCWCSRRNPWPRTSR